MPKPIKSTLRRHSIKKSSTKTGLSKKGLEKARESGRKNFSGKVKGYASDVERAESTLKLGLGAYRAKKGKTYSKTRSRKELSLNTVIRDMDKAVRYIKKYGEEGTLRRWLDGKIPSNVLTPANKIADNIIRKRMGLGQKIAKMGAKDKMLENVSHSWIVEAVFERLTGKKFNTLKPGTMVRETEGLTITHYQNGKAVLRYRGQNFDVTKKLQSIIKK